MSLTIHLLKRSQISLASPLSPPDGLCIALVIAILNTVSKTFGVVTESTGIVRASTAFRGCGPIIHSEELTANNSQNTYAVAA